ncbi:MAG TPA: hypothetical protein VKO20_09115 [Desulfosalsimonadaceae bacterium]|nr:hypothetical protein [Desulfosalsimonadaceae bacterium]
MNSQQPKPKTAYSFTEFLSWTLFIAIPVLTAIYAISRTSAIWTAIYIIVCAVCFLGVEYRFFCTHCPHYNNTNGKTRCMFLWHLPAYFKPRPGPLQFSDKLAAFLGFAVPIVFPIYWLLAHPLLLLVYLLGWALMGTFLKRYECIRCINKNCPMNAAPAEPDTGGSQGSR